MAARPNTYGGTTEIEASDPGSSLVLVAPHATNPLPGGTSRGLWITVAGNLTVRLENDAADVTLTVALGLFPFRVKYVRAAGATATAYAIY